MGAEGWKLSSGNFTDYNLHIRQAYFAPDAAYNNGETTLLQLVGVDDDGEEKKEIFAIGKDWVSTDGGKTVQSIKGSKSINRTTMYGRFITHVIELGNDIANQFQARGDANQAAVWEGAVFHMNEAEIKFGRNLEPTFHNMPDQFLGFEAEGSVVAPVASKPAASKLSPTPPTPAAAAKAKAAAAKAQATAVSPASATSNGSVPDSDIGARLLSIAQASPSFSEFVDAATEIEEVQTDDELLELIVDPSESGYYALNHG